MLVALLIACSAPDDTGAATSTTATTSSSSTTATTTGTTGTGTTTTPPVPQWSTFADWEFKIGELHGHTTYSKDACAQQDIEIGHCGTRDEAVQVALDLGMDFLGLSDHVNGDPAQDPEDFEATLQELYALDGGAMVTVPAGEVFLRDPTGTLGHRNIYLFGTPEQLAGLTLDELSPTGTTAEQVEGCHVLTPWLDALVKRRGPVILVPHHPAASIPMPNDFECFTPYEAVVEVYSSHGNSMSAGASYHPMWSAVAKNSTIEAALWVHGLKFGFIAGTDEHDNRPGETCDRRGPLSGGGLQNYGGGLAIVQVPAGEPWDRQALYDALVQRRVYATSGPQVPVIAEWAADGVVVGRAGEVITGAGGTLALRVQIHPDHAAFVTGVALHLASGAVQLIELSPGIWEHEQTAPLAPEVSTIEVFLDGWDTANLEGPCEDDAESPPVDDERLWLSPTWFE